MTTLLAAPEAAAVEAPTDPGAPVRGASTAHRICTLLAALSLFGVAFATWATSVQLPVTCAISVLGYAAGLGLAVGALAARTDRALRRVDLGVLGLSLVLLVGWAISTLYFQPGYGTDEAAFEQYAANLLLAGHNPYGANLLPALNLFRVPIQYATYTMNGGAASTLGYPALPVLIVAAFVPLTHGVQSVIIANVLALMTAAVLMFRLLPRAWRPLGPLVVVGLPILFGYAISGVNAVLMMTLLLGVAHRWTKVGAGGRLGRGDYARAVLLGLAISTQQLAWFIVPFLLTGLYLLRRGELTFRATCWVLARYLGTAAAVFAAVNAPFIVWNPTAWMSGVAGPVTQHAIPYGQGAIDLTLFFQLGGGDLHLYTYAAAGVLAALLCALAMNFRHLGWATFVLPSVALFFPTRSLAEYFMTLVAVWIMAAATADAADFRRAAQVDWPTRLFRHLGRRTGLLPAVLVFLPAAGLFGMALASPAPLAMAITGVNTTGQLQSVWRMGVDVTNDSGRPLRPHFAANYVGQATTFWNVLSGPAALPAHGHAHYLLAAPNLGSMPGITTPFLLQAVTDSPETISSTGLYTPQPYTAAISPGFVNQVLRPGQPTALQVRLRSPFGGTVHRGGVTVALGQLTYAQDALVPSEARINGRPQGQTPVTTQTNSAGVATFHVVADESQTRPVYFQAWIQPTRRYPFGYSQIVPVMWANPGTAPLAAGKN